MHSKRLKNCFDHLYSMVISAKEQQSNGYMLSQVSVDLTVSYASALKGVVGAPYLVSIIDHWLFALDPTKCNINVQPVDWDNLELECERWTS